MEGFKMQRILIAVAMLCIAATTSQAAVRTHHAGPRPASHRVVRDSSHSVTYDRDSPDPAIGWHWENGMRVCQNDCDNDEIPGSGFSCRDVTAMGMAMRECTRQN
jgi:hypothetical protein